MDTNLITAHPDRLNLIFPDDGLATWSTHIAFEARAPGPSYCFLAITQGRGNLPAVRCTLAMQVQLARLIRRNVKKIDIDMFASIPPEDPGRRHLDVPRGFDDLSGPRRVRRRGRQ